MYLEFERPRSNLYQCSQDIWKPIPDPAQTPHLMSYPMDMTWILQHQVYLLAKCHINVISMPYLFFKKDILGYPEF